MNFRVKVVVDGCENRLPLFYWRCNGGLEVLQGKVKGGNRFKYVTMVEIEAVAAVKE